MKEIKFPLLTKDDIEVRIGQLNKEQTKASLLLYQDARCGMKYLDLVVGVNNWQKKYYEVRGLVICSLGINVNYDEPNKEPYWIWKDDTGSAGTIEEEKSIVSDSFKRCCVCVGLARELYTSPTIWVDIKSKYDKFKVLDIQYNDDREIKSIVIGNEKGEPVFSYPKSTKVSTSGEKVAKNPIPSNDTQVAKPNNAFEEDKKTVREYLDTLPADKWEQFTKYLKTHFGKGSIGELNENEMHTLALSTRR